MPCWTNLSTKRDKMQQYAGLMSKGFWASSVAGPSRGLLRESSTSGDDSKAA